MAVSRDRVATVHVIATCSGCAEVWDNYLTAVDAARDHAKATGHEVHVERLQAWTYNRKRHGS